MWIPWDRRKKQILNLEWKTEDLLITDLCLWILIFTLTLTWNSVKEDSLYQVKLGHFIPTVFEIEKLGQYRLQCQVHNRWLQVSWWVVSVTDQGIGVIWSVSDGYNSVTVKGVSFTGCKPVVKGCTLVSVFPMTESTWLSEDHSIVKRSVTLICLAFWDLRHNSNAEWLVKMIVCCKSLNEPNATT